MLPANKIVALEALILSEALHTPRLLDEYAGALSQPTIFEHPVHKQVAAGIASALAKNIIPTQDTVFAYVTTESHGYLAKLLEATCEPELFPGLLSQLKDEYTARFAAKELEVCLTDLKAGKITHQQVLDRVSTTADRMFDFSDNRSIPISEGIAMVEGEMQEMVDHGEPVGGMIFSWWPALAKVMGYIRRGELILIAARPGHGKTSWLISLAYHIATLWLATHSTRRVLYITAEEIVEDISARFLKADDELFNEEVDAASHTLMKQIATKFRNENWPIDIAASYDLTPAEVRRFIRAHIRRYGPNPIVMVDYLGLMRSDRVNGTTAEDLNSIIRALKLMALELNCIILLAAQLKREVDQRKDEEVFLSDVQGTGGAEQHPNRVLFLRRKEDEGTETHLLTQHYIKVLIPKQRRGQVIINPNDAIKLSFIPTRSFIPKGEAQIKVFDANLFQQTEMTIEAELGI